MEIICCIKVTQLKPVNDGATVLLGRHLTCRRHRPRDAVSDRVRQDEARPQVIRFCAAAAAAAACPAVAAAGQDDPGGVRRARQLGGE